MTTVTVCQAVLADLEDLSLLFGEYRAFQGKHSEPEAERAFLQARFDHGESVVFMAYEAKSPVGFAQLYPSYSSTSLARVFILNDLFVRDSARRKGVASELLAAVERYAWALGAVRVTLNVAQANQVGQTLYDARGWTKDSEFFMYHRFAPKVPDAGAGPTLPAGRI
jgi:GNAT superfamily N-acetyltransferase